jgi:hypothetical protein
MGVDAQYRALVTVFASLGSYRSRRDSGPMMADAETKPLTARLPPALNVFICRAPLPAARAAASAPFV